jgi:isopenicillin N synthase-like dioxygenase
VSEQPPIIDISGLERGGDAAQRVADTLVDPCSEWGGFQIVGHGVPEDHLARLEAAMHAFFDLPAETKQTLKRTRDNARGYYDEELTKNQRDWKEVLDYGAERADQSREARHSDGVNQWPPGMPELREVLLAHYHHCERVALALLRALCQSLGLRAGTLDPAFERHTSFVRLNRYAACPDAAPADAPLFPGQGRLGVYHHTDAGALTLVYQDEVPGLQLEHGDGFVIVQPVPGAFAVNLGDMLRVWSNDRYRSPVHRVIANSERTRHSAPFFLNPSYDEVCEPLPELINERTPLRFRPVSWSHFRDQRSAGDYRDQGEEVQVDQYLVD